MISRLEATSRRYHEIENEMARPEVATDHEKLTKLAREQRTLREIVQAYDAYRKARKEMESARSPLGFDSHGTGPIHPVRQESSSSTCLEPHRSD